jgi:hypothetical protein
MRSYLAVFQQMARVWHGREIIGESGTGKIPYENFNAGIEDP